MSTERECVREGGREGGREGEKERESERESAWRRKGREEIWGFRVESRRVAGAGELGNWGIGALEVELMNYSVARGLWQPAGVLEV